VHYAGSKDAGKNNWNFTGIFILHGICGKLKLKGIYSVFMKNGKLIFKAIFSFSRGFAMLFTLYFWGKF
jgi:hypothetical protein